MFVPETQAENNPRNGFTSDRTRVGRDKIHQELVDNQSFNKCTNYKKRTHLLEA
jgi:hypothetical protein